MPGLGGKTGAEFIKVVLKGTVRSGGLFQVGENFVQFGKKLVAFCEMAVLGIPKLTFELANPNLSLLDKIKGLGRASVDKLGPHLDGNFRSAFRVGVDPSTDAIACI